MIKKQILRFKNNLFCLQPIFIIISLTIISLDQIIKKIIFIYKPQFEIYFIKISYVTNTGAGFGILKGNSFYLGLISLCVSIFLIYHYNKISIKKLPQIFIGLFFGGTVGNLIDRLTQQYVIDYFGTSFWPSFNLADSAITISTVGLIYLILKNKLLKK